ncbi:MAG: radical SAM protein, partial [Acutalibacteraceae bacterium]
MTDSYGRKIEYLRLSVTKRCPLRCIYCKEEAENRENELSAAQLEKIVRAFAFCGITKVRLTGGEPLMRSDIIDIAERIRQTDGIRKLVITTNGVRLKEYAKGLQESGVSAVNVSLDTLDKEKYKALTGCDCLQSVLDGIEEAQRCGISHIRINSVLIR